MSGQERSRPEEREAAAPRETPLVAEEEKGAAPRASAPFVPMWLAFLSAGICGAAAGYLLATVETFRVAFVSMGVELPWITQVVMSNPLLVPAGLIATSSGLLGLGAWRGRWTPAWSAARGLGHTAAVLAALAGCVLIMSNVLVFYSLHRALQH